MYFFLSICKQDPNLFISFTFYLGMGARRAVFEGCFQTLVSNETKLTSKANNNYVQRVLFYYFHSIFQASSNKFGNRLELYIGFTFCRGCLSRSAITNTLAKLRPSNVQMFLGRPNV